MSGNTYPIILAHGIARFDYLTNAFLKRMNLYLWERSFAQDRFHYFKGIAPYLRAHGFEVYPTGVSFASDVATRAKDLSQELQRVLKNSGQVKVHVIGHSMGGLDGRAMIVNEGCADQVASMTSIGTPHLGTCFADWGLTHGGHEIIQAAREVVDLAGFENLTGAAMKTFNEQLRNAEAENSVIYQTYAASQTQERVFGPIQGPWKIIQDGEGENDGLVSVHSQRWVKEIVSDAGVVKRIRQFDFPMSADHLNQVGWWDIRELLKLRWWRTGLIKEKVRFETAVKNAYLQIAQSLVELDV